MERTCNGLWGICFAEPGVKAYGAGEGQGGQEKETEIGG